MNGTNATEYCNLREFALEMRNVHGYLSLIVCIFGSISNILNICVLTTREMRIPTNFILTGLAVSDLLVMLEYFPFTSHNYLNSGGRKQAAYFSHPWAIYMYFHALFTQVCHFNSCCLTVMLAGWRYIALNHPSMNKVWCNPYRTKLAIFASCVLCPFVCTPLFLALEIQERAQDVYPNGTIRQLNDMHNDTSITSNFTQVKIYVLDLDKEYAKINLVIYGVVLKLIPCVLLTVLSVLLIRSLWDAKKRWKNLSNNSGVPLVKTMDQQRKALEKEQQADRTTRMLLVVLLLFLIPEIPQATMGLLSAVMPNTFRANCYDNLGDLFDIMVLVGSSITFILYCSMSAQFRTAFHKMFKFDAASDFLKRHLRPQPDPDADLVAPPGGPRITPAAGKNGKHKEDAHSVRHDTEHSTTELNNVAKKQPVHVEANIPDSVGVRV